MSESPQKEAEPAEDAGEQPAFKRRKKFVNARIQLAHGRRFVVVTTMALLAHAAIQAYFLLAFAQRLPTDGAVLETALPKLLGQGLGLTAGVFVPLAMLVGIRSMFPVVGPLHRFRSFLEQVVNRERPGPCSIRKEDELQQFCDLLNEATALIRYDDVPDGEVATADAPRRGRGPRRRGDGDEAVPPAQAA